MKKRNFVSSALFSAVATATAYAADGNPGGQNDPPVPSGLFGISYGIWAIIAVVVVAAVFFLLKGKKQ